MSETHFVLGGFWKNHFNRLLAASDQPHPTAANLRRWMNQPEERGRLREIQNLLLPIRKNRNHLFVLDGAMLESIVTSAEEEDEPSSD